MKFHQTAFIALSVAGLLGVATSGSIAAQEGRMMRTMPHGTYQCALPGDAAGTAFKEVKEAEFAIGTASRYISAQGEGIYLLRGRELVFTRGPRKGERYKRIGTNQLKRRNADGTVSKLLCSRLGGTG